jgi:hypothetical protein
VLFIFLKENLDDEIKVRGDGREGNFSTVEFYRGMFFNEIFQGMSFKSAIVL